MLNYKKKFIIQYPKITVYQSHGKPFVPLNLVGTPRGEGTQIFFR